MYNLNPDYAREGDSGQSNRITESGAYTGVFTIAKMIKASTGSVGIEFTFQDSLSREAKYLTLYTHNKDSKEIYGLKQLHAIMTCMGVKTAVPVKMTATVYDFDTKKEVQQQIDGFPELINVPIGLVLQKELYRKNDGSDGERMGFYSFFESETRRTATERLDNTAPEALDIILKNLQDKNTRGIKQGGNAAQQQTAPQAQQQEPAINFDDDIPF